MHDRLRQQWRERVGKAPEPTAAIIDAQSTRSTPQGGDTGFDAGKKVKGRKRHLVVDTLELLLAVTVTAASVQNRDGAACVVAQAKRQGGGSEEVVRGLGLWWPMCDEPGEGPRHRGEDRAQALQPRDGHLRD